MFFSDSRIINLKFGDNGLIALDVSGLESWISDGLGEQERSEVRIICSGLIRGVVTHRVYNDEGLYNSKIIAERIFREFASTYSISKDDSVILQKVRPQEFRLFPTWKDFTFIDLFAGIGGIRLGMEAVGGKCVFSSEWDEMAQITYEANFGERPHGDITSINEEMIPPHDMLAAGFPCQPFSIIGKREGFSDTRGTLFFEIERIIRKHLPQVVFLENVKQFKTHDKGRTCKIVIDSLQKLGYSTNISVLNAMHYGVAQKRERTFIIGFRDDKHFKFPAPHNYRPSLSSVLEPEESIDSSLIASSYIQSKRKMQLEKQGKAPFYPSIWHENKGGQIGIHPFSCALRHNASHNYLLVNGNRRLSSREMLRLQGFPESFKIAVSHVDLRAQAGNSVAVPVITSIAAEICTALRTSQKPLKPVMQRELFQTG